jgi:hypothetical protein
VIVEADEGFLLGGRTIDSGLAFDAVVDTLGHMKPVIEMNVKAHRRVRLGKVVPFRGMVSRPVLLSRDEGRRGLPT